MKPRAWMLLFVAHLNVPERKTYDVRNGDAPAARQCQSTPPVTAAQRRWLDGASLRFGVNNLFDLKPPLSADSRGYDPSEYNVVARGRTYSLQVTKKL